MKTKHLAIISGVCLLSVLVGVSYIKLSEVDVQISEDELTLDLLLSPEMKVYSINNHEFVFEKSVSDKKHVISANGEERWNLHKFLHSNWWILSNMDRNKDDIPGKLSIRKKPLTDDEIHNIIKVMNFSLNKNYFMNEKINLSNKTYKFGLETFQTMYGVIHGNAMIVFFEKNGFVNLSWDDNVEKWGILFGDTKRDIKYVGQGINPINYRMFPKNDQAYYDDPNSIPDPTPSP